MTTTTWKNGMTGDFNVATNWTNGVPALGSTALITAPGTYTVTSSQNNTIGTLDMASGAKLDITADTFFLTLGSGAGALGGQIAIDTTATLQIGASLGASTINNTGTISTNGGTNSFLNIEGLVTLVGDGILNFDKGGHITGASSGSTFINSSNTIMGNVAIGTSGGPLDFVNGAKGVIEAGLPNQGGSESILIGANTFQNSGLLETAPGSTGSDLAIDSDVIQTTTGRIEAAGGAGSQLVLDENHSIVGGTISIAANNLFLCSSGTLLEPAKAIANAGTIQQSSGGTLFIDGSVTNAGAGGLVAFNNSSIVISGTVTKGTAEVASVGSITFGGPSSANVGFGAGFGELVLDDATKFTGTVSGIAGNSQALIDLENISFADGFTIAFAKGVLTVTDATTKVADKIKISGTPGTFVGTENLSDGSVAIHDPPAASQSANIPLLANYVASSFAGAAHGDVPPATATGSHGAPHELSLALPQGS